jgi:hypothetical protein
VTHISRRDYTTRKRITYSYEATWELAADVVSWNANVWKGGHIVGSQQGSFSNPPAKDIGDLVAGRVRAYLETADVSYRWRVLTDGPNTNFERMMGKVLAARMTEEDALRHEKSTGRVLQKVPGSSDVRPI